jgi:hypothetical protein
MTEHTPTPWLCDSEGILPAYSGGDISVIARVPNHPENAKNWAANAAYIVKACNAFPDLVKALEDAALQLEYMQERMPTGTSAAVLARINHLLVGVKSPGEPNG